MRVIVAGAGPGAEEFYTGKMKAQAAAADVILTSERLAGPMKELNSNVVVAGVMETVDYIRRNAASEETVCVAASGDTGFYSIASTIRKNLPEGVEAEFICGISSMQYFAAVTGIGYEDLKLISLHGKTGSAVPFVCYNKKVFALTGGRIKAEDVIRELCEAGLGRVRVHVGEALSSRDQRVMSGSAEELSGERFDDLTVMIMENDFCTDRYRTLRDGDFVRGKTPMTKAAIRDLAVAGLEIHPTDVVYDIGAGTGSVTCALALKASESFVYAVEKEEDAAALIRENMEKLGVRNIRLVCGTAPAAMEGFPPADKVFIGGSTGNLAEIVSRILSDNEEAVMMVTAVTLETLAEAVGLFKDLGLAYSVSCVNVANAQRLGRYDLMKAENPVYMIRGEKKVEG
jgi:precorrin-6Y C5,15-methyltransferase (decarboxylating)